MKKVALILLLIFFSLSAMENSWKNIVICAKKTKQKVTSLISFQQSQSPLILQRDFQKKLPNEIWQQIFEYVLFHDPKNEFVLDHLYYRLSMTPCIAKSFADKIYTFAQKLAVYEKPRSRDFIDADVKANYNNANPPIFFKRAFQKQKMEFLKKSIVFFQSCSNHSKVVLHQECAKKVNQLFESSFTLQWLQEKVFDYALPAERTLADNVLLLIIAGATFEFKVWEFGGKEEQRISTITCLDIDHLTFDSAIDWKNLSGRRVSWLHNPFSLHFGEIDEKTEDRSQKQKTKVNSKSGKVLEEVL
jgi:hypothetical protein